MIIVGRVLTINEPIVESTINVIGDENLNEKVDWAWSFDGINWTEYVNHETYLSNTRTEMFYFRIRFKELIQPDIFINDIEVFNFNVVFDHPDTFKSVVEPCINMYSGWDCALSMQRQMSDSIIYTYGIPIYYFKVEGIEETKDFNFKEYILHEVQSIKNMKMMITDGEMPDSRPTLTEFDWNFETEWEVELSKTYFNQAFGETAFPHSRDFIYVPMQGRMYEVNSAYEPKEEGFLWQTPIYRLSLTKYTNKTNIEKDELEIDKIEELISESYDDFFSNESLEEQESTGVKQIIPIIPQNNTESIFLGDLNRKTITKNLIIEDEQLNHKGIISCKRKYISKLSDEILYQIKPKGEEFTISTIFKFKGYDTNTNIIDFGNIRLDYTENTLIFGNLSMPIIKDKTYLLILRTSFIENKYDMKLIEHKLKEDITKIHTSDYYFDFDNSSYQEYTFNYDFILENPTEIKLNPFPFDVYNFKVYSTYITNEKDTIKYTSRDKKCILNDTVIKINDGRGYATS